MNIILNSWAKGSYLFYSALYLQEKLYKRNTIFLYFNNNIYYLKAVKFRIHDNILLGELSVLYLFLKHQFNWSPINFGVYMFYSMVIESIGKCIQ